MILYGSETDAESVEFRLIMEALERNEQLFRFCHDETDSVVADEACQSAVNLRHAEFDDWRFLLLCKLPGIAEEVFHDNHEQPGIPVDHNPILNPKRCQTLRLALWELWGQDLIT